MKVFCLSLCLLITMTLTSCRGGRLIAIGLTKQGHVIAARFNERMYQRHLERALLEVTDSVHEATSHLISNQTHAYELQLIAIGVNLRAEIGFPPFKAGIVPGLRAFFTNVDNPPPLP